MLQRLNGGKIVKNNVALRSLPKTDLARRNSVTIYSRHFFTFPLFHVSPFYGVFLQVFEPDDGQGVFVRGV